MRTKSPPDSELRTREKPLKKSSDGLVDPEPLLRESLDEQLRELRAEKEDAFGLRLVVVYVKIGLARVRRAVAQTAARW